MFSKEVEQLSLAQGNYKHLKSRIMKDIGKNIQLNIRNHDKFKEFVASQYIMMPNKDSSSFKLICALQESIYHLLQKKGGLASMSIAMMNEERRKKKHLPPLQIVDYNCMDRAATKLRMVLDCLQVSRRMSGMALLPRNLQEQHQWKKYEFKKESYKTLVTKVDHLSIRLYKLIGLHHEIDTHKINVHAARI